MSKIFLHLSTAIHKSGVVTAYAFIGFGKRVDNIHRKPYLRCTIEKIKRIVAFYKREKSF